MIGEDSKTCLMLDLASASILSPLPARRVGDYAPEGKAYGPKGRAYASEPDYEGFSCLSGIQPPQQGFTRFIYDQRF
jgi:hypothetical protein